MRHDLHPPDDQLVARVERNVSRTLGPSATGAVRRAADLLRREVADRPPAPRRLAQGDFMPKNLLVDNGSITGVIDWEFAGSAAPAFDLARWEVSAGAPFDDRLDLLRRGYARVSDPDTAAAGLTAAFAIDWMFEMLDWKNPATPAQFQRCVALIDRYTR